MQKSKPYLPLILLLLQLFIASICSAQSEDSLYIKDYKKKNDAELYNGYNTTKLRFITKGEEASAVSLFANNSLFTGLYMDYKWFTVGYGINVPFTSRDNSVKGFKSYRFNFNSYISGWGIAGSADMFKGLLSQTYKNNYTPVDGVQYTNISADVYRVANNRYFSYSAARRMGQQQLQNSGSFIYHIRPAYYALGIGGGSIENSDTTLPFLDDNPRWLSLTVSAAYAYNFVWDGGKWLIAPRAEVGVGALYQFGIQQRFKPTLSFRSALTAGYSDQKWYLYANAETVDIKSFFATTVLKEDRFRVSLTTGFRLGSLKKKILGVL